MFIGTHCPKCGKRLKYIGKCFVGCRCGWSYAFPESNLEKRFPILRFCDF